jgi:stage II sporulation protein AA (anti-sigma F factor antagonist)
MQMSIEDLDGDVKKAILSGSLDINGAGEIELGLSALAGKNDRILVDLADVEFLASIGIRVLVINAQTLARRGGALVIVHPQPLVEEVLQTAGIDNVIAIYKNTETALEAMNWQ